MHNLSLNHLPGQRMVYKKSGPGRHSSNPTLSAWSEKLIIMFSLSALLAEPSRYHQVNGEKFPPPSAEYYRRIHHYRPPSAPHVYQCSVFCQVSSGHSNITASHSQNLSTVLCWPRTDGLRTITYELIQW